MNYLTHVNNCITRTIATRDRFVSFGQNIAAGSHLSGLTRNLPRDTDHHVINTPNCENALTGFGFGLMLQGVDSAFFCKQLDFLLLGCDQIVNTFNMVRQSPCSASFTIVCIVVDSGFQGPQSRLNNLADLSSLADIPVFAAASGPDAEVIFGHHLIAPGFRIIAVSERLFPTAIGPTTAAFADVGGADKGRMFRHASGADATVVSFNFAWPQAAEIGEALKARGLAASHFSVAGLPVSNWDAVLADVRRTGKLILVDDSRSPNRLAEQLRLAVSQAGIDCRIVPLYRPVRPQDIAPNADKFSVDCDRLLQLLATPQVG